MYAVNTELTLKEQRPPDDETDEPFPYNKVRVIGQSPISHSHKGEWEGADAEGVILAPLTNFGANLDEPFGKCRLLYDVSFVPERTVPVNQPVRVIDSSTAEAGATPEEVFATEAPGKPREEGRTRAWRSESPLGDVKNPAKQGPLD